MDTDQARKVAQNHKAQEEQSRQVDIVNRAVKDGTSDRHNGGGVSYSPPHVPSSLPTFGETILAGVTWGLSNAAGINSGASAETIKAAEHDKALYDTAYVEAKKP